MANPVERALEFWAHVGERTQTPRDYLGSLVNRSIGIRAGIEAKRRNNSAFLYGSMEFLAPATSRYWVPKITEDPMKPALKTLLPSMVTDVALTLPLALSHNFQELLAIKLATNASANIIMDLFDATVKRVRDTTLKTFY